MSALIRAVDAPGSPAFHLTADPVQPDVFETWFFQLRVRSNGGELL
jgi:hypothetical protein